MAWLRPKSQQHSLPPSCLHDVKIVVR